MATELEPPNSPMTLEHFIEMFQREEDRKDKEFTERLDKLSDRMHQECTELSEYMHKECSDLKAELLKALEPSPSPKIEPVTPTVEIEQLKKENASLRSQIQALWKLFTEFFSKKVSVIDNQSAFFSKKESQADSVVKENSNGLRL